MLAFLKFKKVSQLHTIAHAVRRSHFKPLPDIRKILDQPAQVRTMYGVHCTMYILRTIQNLNSILLLLKSNITDTFVY